MKQPNLWTILLLVLVGVLAGCTLGEAELPAPTPLGRTASQEAGVVAAVPGPITHSLEGREDCFTCHAIGAVEAPPVPVGHAEDVQECTLCHAVWTRPGIAAVAAPAVRHEVEGKEDCLTCHKVGTADAPRIPDNHAGLPSAICLSCHVQGDEVVGGTVEDVSVASPIPHGVEGFETCTLCHEEGGAGIPAFPSDHAGRSDDICTACHSASGPSVEEPESSPVEEPVVSASDTPVAAVKPEATPEPAPIPHSLDGRAACSLCHEEGGAGTPRFPDDHAGRSDSTCVACHAAPVEEAHAVATSEPSTEAEDSDEGPDTIPHALEGREACTACHGGGAAGIPQFPDDHAGRADTTCVACHQVAAEG